MSDIVERLRSYARNCGGPPEEYLTWQAADEIERNDEHYNAAMAMSEKHRKAWVEASQRIAELLAALEEVERGFGEWECKARDDVRAAIVKARGKPAVLGKSKD